MIWEIFLQRNRAQYFFESGNKQGAYLFLFTFETGCPCSRKRQLPPILPRFMINFEFEADYVLENERALLCPLNSQDYDRLLPFSLQEPELWQFSLVQASGAAQLRNYIDLALAARKAQKEYPFIIYDKREKAYAGTSRFYDIQLTQKCLQLGYTWYGRAFQGTGLNKHCKFLLLQFAFEQMGIERVEFRADSRNEKSIAAMISIGCTLEGVLRSNGFTAEGTRRDSTVLSILKAEWHSVVKERLQHKMN